MTSQSYTQYQGSADKMQKTFHNSGKLDGWEVGSRYQLVDVLGKGSYGQVAKAIDRNDGKIVAIKQMKRVFDEPIDAKRAYREMHILGHLRHPNVVPLIDVVSSTINCDYERSVMYGDFGGPGARIPKSLGNLYLIFEYFDTDLSKIIKSNQFLTTEHIQYIMQQILDGLRYIHKSNVIHRDIKPANVLVSCGDCTIKIADFGLSRVFGPSSKETSSEVSGLNNDRRAVVTPTSAECCDIEADSIMSDADLIRCKHYPHGPVKFAECYSSSTNHLAMERPDELGRVGVVPGGANIPAPPILKRCLTKHVVTRWYRAPEVILAQSYTSAVDMWSVGCIFAELLGLMKENNPNYRTRKALFPGERCGELSAEDHMHGSMDSVDIEETFGTKSQLGLIFDVIGTPRECDIQYLDDKTKALMRRLKSKPKKMWKSMYPAAPDNAIDLLDSLLQFDPNNRLTAEQAMGHPFFSTLSCLTYLENYQNSSYPPRITSVVNRIEHTPCSAGSKSVFSPHTGLTPIPMNVEMEKMGESEENLKHNIIQEILVYRRRDKMSGYNKK